MPDEGPAPGTVVDARGRACPLPIIDAARAARSLPAGAHLTVLADDPAALLDIPAWCRMTGHVLLRTGELAAGDQVSGWRFEVVVSGGNAGGIDRASGSRPR